jgi:hypothetical protein
MVTAVIITMAAAVCGSARSPAGPADKGSAKTAEALALDQKLIMEAKTQSEIMSNLTHISDVIGPRLTGSANLKRANEWAAEKMKSYGLTNVQLEPWSIPVGWERGTVTAKLVEPDNGRSLLMCSAGWSPGTKGKITGEVVILEARNSADLTKYKGKLKDAIIMRGPPARVMPITDLSGRSDGFSPGQPGSANRRRDTPPPAATPPADAKANPDKKAVDSKPAAAEKAKPDDAKAAPDQKANPDKKPDDPKPNAPATPNQNPSPRAERAQYGEFMAFRAELADFLRTEGAAAMLSDSAKPQGLLVTTGGWRGTDRADSPEPIPTLYVAHEHYALLHRLATRADAKKPRVELEVTNKFIPGEVVVYNTVGEIKGSEKPDEFVVLGAHIDSWDLAQGTTDNGTGTCIVLEAARILAKSGVKPKRTIRFCLFSGEEQGLHGSRQYVKKHEAEMPKTSMCLVHDTGTGKVTGIGLQGRAAIKPILDAELVSLKDIGVTDISLRGMSGSDHQSFERAGVPGFMIAQDMSEYRFTHHTQTDTLDKANEANLIQGAQVMAIAAMRVANLDDLLPRDKPEAPAGRRGGR